MKKFKLLILLPLMLLTSCSEKRTYVTSVITNKYDYTYNQVISNGKVTTVVIHHRYIFQFNEVKPYNKPVDNSTYEEYNVGDEYTFWIDEKEKEYFFPDSYETVETEE